MVDNPENTDAAPQTMRQPFRWRLIPGTFFLLMGVLGLLGVTLVAVVVVYVNLRYGLIVPSPDTPTRNKVALTLANVVNWQLALWSAIASLIAGASWLRGRWRIAWVATFAFFGLAAVGSFLESHTLE